MLSHDGTGGNESSIVTIDERTDSARAIGGLCVFPKQWREARLLND